MSRSMSTSTTTKTPGGRVYAVTSGNRPGIYFDWKGDAELAFRGGGVTDYCSMPFQSFPSIAQAHRYLESRGLTRKSCCPTSSTSTSTGEGAADGDDGGWIMSRSKDPILYTMVVSSIDGTLESNSPYKSLKRPLTMSPPANIVDLSTSSSSPLSSSSPDHLSHWKRPRTTIERTDTNWKLDSCQQRAIDAARNGQNVFLTGVAGTGKSLITKIIYEQALARWGNQRKRVALCAPTGMAAVGLGINGQTIHTLAGLRIPHRASDFQSMHGRGNQQKWQTLECLILDEVGMVAADFLDWLDINVRRIRHCPLEPFGGIQLIFVGDFAQLGPVPGSISLLSQRSRHHGPPYPPDQAGADCFLNIHELTAFAFQSAMWREADFCHVHLTEVYRQTDRAFVQALMDLRQQRPDSSLVQNLVDKCSISLDDPARSQVFGEAALTVPEGLLPTLLYTNNRNADRENAERLASLSTEYKQFVSQDSVHVDEEVPSHMTMSAHDNLQKNKFFEQCQASKFLDLKVGAQVMLVQNISPEEELINGSRGVVERFCLIPVVKNFAGSEERLLGPDDFDKYPGYTFEQLKFGMPFDFDNMTWKICKFVKYPLVKFLNNRTKIILPTTFERTLFRQGTCRRVQLPLRLSWALTIHKAQGCTLDWLICDLAGCFTAGQAYVALSRAKSMAGLQIRNFSTKAVLSNPLVDGFYQALENHTIPDFLRNQAGLWWYPLLDHPEWLSMFSSASSTTQAKANAFQFRLWVANYKPPEQYQGWNGYCEHKKTTPASRSPLSSSTRFEPRTVTPTTNYVQTTLPVLCQSTNNKQQR